jgi:Sel1 repeat
MFNLGLLYDEGHGVAQDYAKAREWYEKAADKGDTTAMKNLGWLYANAQGVARDYAKTREWWERRGEIGSRYCGGVPGPAYRNSPLSRPGWVIVPIPSTSVGADPEQDVDARVAMASSERGNQGQAASKR